MSSAHTGPARRQSIPRLVGTLVPVLLLAACSGSEGPTGPDPTDEPCTLASRCLARLEVAPDRWLRHYRTHDLDTGAEGVTRALILVHGAGRNAPFNFGTGIQAAYESGRSVETVAVVAPFFITTEDDPVGDEPWWSNGGWKRGHLSRSEGPSPRVSSYQAIDTIIARLSNPVLFPDMTEIVLAGHSAGGQVAHRYAAGGMDPMGVPIRYVVANPSTYLYLGPERADGSGGFAVPEVSACPDYQEWHYGLEDLNSYMTRLSDGEIEERLTTRDVTIMVGDRDTGTTQLDQTCGANLQGEHRFQRGLNLMAYMDARWSGHQHAGVVVPFVAHSSRGMFLSDAGLEALLP